MKHLYAELCNQFAEQEYKIAKNEFYNFRNMSHFVAMKGRNYSEQKCRLMIIGRAVNGWGSIEYNVAKDFGERAEHEFNKTGFAWIESDETGLHNIPKPNSDEKVYLLSRSAFWRTSKRVWERLSHNAQKRWIDYIVWSNIYKIAPPKAGNPTGEMCNRQIECCRKILKKEIEIYRPTHILFVTGWSWWFDDSDNKVGVSCLFKNRLHIGDNKKENLIFVEGTAQYKDNCGSIPVVIACRPERRNETKYVEQIVGRFDLMRDEK